MNEEYEQIVLFRTKDSFFHSLFPVQLVSHVRDRPARTLFPKFPVIREATTTNAGQITGNAALLDRGEWRSRHLEGKEGGKEGSKADREAVRQE
jgi:hypothetical protein